jgi:hypothetical protein
MRASTARLSGFAMIVLLLSVVSSLGVLFVLGTWHLKLFLVFTAILAFFLCAPLGGFLWMLYDISRREPRPLIYFVLAFVPYAFVWYYFARSHSKIHDASLLGPASS